MRHFADHAEDAIPTLGIVAINIDQRDLIFEELRRLQAGDPLVERYREKVRRRQASRSSSRTWRTSRATSATSS